jgi:NADH-quinone oxidoreductase subunit H
MADVFTTISDWFTNLLTGWGLGPVATDAVQNLVGALIIIVFCLVMVVFNIWLERKLIGRLQDRFGPNRTGPFGLFQTIADVLKLLLKEVIVPDQADKIPYFLAPSIAVASVFLIWAVMPFASTAIGSDVTIGALYFFAVSSLGIMAVLMAGWSSNNKYATLGGFRAVAMLVSYEVPMVLALLVPVALAGTLRMSGLVESQTIWYVFLAPIAMLIFFISSTAEVGRSPFDLLEAESELVAGYQIEYSGMAFAMFYLAEFLHAFTISALTATLFLGGWRGPGAEQIPTLGVVYFFIKTFAVYFVSIWVRGSMPRLRIDQVMDFNWKFLVPVSLVTLMVIALVDKLGLEIIPNYVASGGFVEMLPRAGVLLLTNLLIVLVTMLLIGAQGRRARRAAMAEAVE